MKHRKNNVRIALILFFFGDIVGIVDDFQPQKRVVQTRDGEKHFMEFVDTDLM